MLPRSSKLFKVLEFLDRNDFGVPVGTSDLGKDLALLPDNKVDGALNSNMLSLVCKTLICYVLYLLLYVMLIWYSIQ